MRYKFFILGLILFLPLMAKATSTNIIISQIQIAGETTTDEFVELYNPTDSPVSLDDWKLVKKTKSGTQSNLVSKFAEGTNIGAHKFFLITHQTGYQGNASADITYTGKTYSAAANNTIILLGENGMEVDKVGFGIVNDYEHAPAINPDAGQSLKRKGWETLNFIDSDNNQADFFISASSPRNSMFADVIPPPVVENPPQPETPPVVEPVESADSVITDNTDNTAVPQVTETPAPAVTPSETEGSHTTQEADEISRLPSAARNDEEVNADQNDDGKITKTAKAGEENVVKSPSASPLEKGGLRGISEIKKLKNDSKVKIRGVVSVPPSVLGGQIFYLSGSGIQIYMFKKDFPDLKIGDTVDIEGTLSEAYGEKRIKLASRDSIKFVSSGEAPAPREIAADEIGESMEGSLVKISGEIIEIKKDFWYLADGEKEIEVLLKEGANIPFDLVKEGDKVQITGIVSQYNEEYRLLPRSVDDIKILKKNNSEILTQENQNKRSFGVKDYLFVGIPSLLLAGFLVVRRRVKKNKETQEKKNKEI